MDLHLHPPHWITRLISIINTGLVSLSLLKPSSSTLPTLFLWQRAERLHRDPLWESQQCKWLLMACNGRGAWAVYCCFDKLSMTCVVWGQSECKTTECWEKMTDDDGDKGRGKNLWENEREMRPSVVLHRTFKHFQGGQGKRWRCCYLKVASVM